MIKRSQKFKDWCKSKKLNEDLVYLTQCAILSDSKETINILLDSLDGEIYDLLVRVVLCEDIDGELKIKPNIPLFNMTESESKKISNKDFKALIKGLSNLSVEMTNRFGYFFSPKNAQESAKLMWETSNYTIDKSIKVIEKYYTDWTSDINPKGLFNLLLSPEFEILYSKYKESESDFWD